MAKRGCPKTMKLKSIAWGRPLSIILPGKFIFRYLCGCSDMPKLPLQIRGKEDADGWDGISVQDGPVLR